MSATTEPTVTVRIDDAMKDGWRKNEVQEEQSVTGDEQKTISRRCWAIGIAIAVVIVVVAFVLCAVLGVFRSNGPSYKVEIHWKARTFDGWNLGYLEFRTETTLQDGGEAWDSQKKLMVKLDVQDKSKAVVKSETHHICCAEELQAGVNTVVNSEYWGNWGRIKKCRCDQLWYDHQIRAKVTKIEEQSDNQPQIDLLPEADIDMNDHNFGGSPCGAPQYKNLPSPATCEDLLQQGHTNSYWDNSKFLCRTNKQPCEFPFDYAKLEMNLGNGLTLKFNAGFGPAEVWPVYTDGSGNPRSLPQNTPYQFWSENGWRHLIPEDFNDYRFGSLDCGPRRQQDDDGFLFIIIDGVLVDSCPKSVAEKCRACTA